MKKTKNAFIHSKKPKTTKTRRTSLPKKAKIPIKKIKTKKSLPRTSSKKVKAEKMEKVVKAEVAIIEEIVPPCPEDKTKNYLNNKDLVEEVVKSKQKGEMSDKLARMLHLLCSRYAKRANYIGYCVDEDTQALTKRGWVSYCELSKQDEILSYNIDTGSLVWSKVLGVFVDPSYDGKMHYLTTQGLDALVTPGHKFVSLERGIVNVEDVVCNEHIVLMGRAITDTTTIYSDAFVQVVGWAITEGHFSTKSAKKHSIDIFQKEGAKAYEIERCLIEANIPFKRYVKKNNEVKFHCTGKDITSIHQRIAPNRVLSTEFILNLTTSQRHMLIKTMVAGDGWIRPSGGMSYCQKDKAHIDAFLMLCTIAGYTTSTATHVFRTPVSGRKPSGESSECFIVNIYASPKLYCKAERIDFHGGRCGPGERREQKQNMPTQQYKGVVWCPQTEYGTFVCRRRGYIYITGNSYNEDMQSYAMLMLVKTWQSFNPERSQNAFAFYTQCIHHSFSQYLNKEKQHRNIRDRLLLENGMSPSFGFVDDGSDHHIVDDEENFYVYISESLERSPSNIVDETTKTIDIDDNV